MINSNYYAGVSGGRGRREGGGRKGGQHVHLTAFQS